MDPPSVTSVTSYPPGAFAAGPGGGGGISLAGCSLVPRLQPAAIASIRRTPYIDRPRFTRTSEFDDRKSEAIITSFGWRSSQRAQEACCGFRNACVTFSSEGG